MQRRVGRLGVPGAPDARSSGPSTRAREAEVGDADAAVAADEHVVGLEVAVEEADRVRGLQPARGLVEHVEDLAPRARPAA